MKFAIIIYTDAALLDALPEGQFDAKMRDCLAFADELRQDGQLLDSQMLQGAATAKSLRVRNGRQTVMDGDRKSTRLNSSHLVISYAVFCLKKKTTPANVQLRLTARPATGLPDSHHSPHAHDVLV